MQYELQKKLEKEFYIGKRLSRMESLFQYCVTLYNRLYHFVAIQEGITDPARLVLLYQQLFGHTSNQRYLPSQLHGSTGLFSPLFYKKLPQKSNFYFDIVLTSLTHAMYQYRKVGLLSIVQGIDYKNSSIFEAQRCARSHPNVPPVRIEDCDLALEEVIGRFGQEKEISVTSSGESSFSLSPCDYRSRLENQLGAPCLTGRSSNAYLMFKFFANIFHLEKQSLIDLRNAIVAYFLAAHDHSLVEILDSINLALSEDEFSGCRDSLIFKLESPCDYGLALEYFEGLVNADSKPKIQVSIDCLLKNESFPMWVTEIIQKYVTHYLREFKEEAPGILYAEISRDLREILETIALLKPEHMKTLLGEENNEHTLTTLQSLIEIYCASRLSNVNFKLLQFESLMTAVEDSSTQEHADGLHQLLYNMGLGSTSHGNAFKPDVLAKVRLKPSIGFNEIPPQSTRIGTGAIICAKNQTRLLEMMWIIGAMQEKQDFFMISAPGKIIRVHEIQCSTWEAYQIALLQYHHYEYIEQENIAGWRAPENEVQLDLINLMTCWEQLAGMGADEIKHANRTPTLG